MGSQSPTRLTDFPFSLSCIGEGNGNPLQCSSLENPRDWGAWWAAVYRVAQSWTWLKQLSSSSSIPTLCFNLLFALMSVTYCLMISVWGLERSPGKLQRVLGKDGGHPSSPSDHRNWVDAGFPNFSCSVYKWGVPSVGENEVKRQVVVEDIGPNPCSSSSMSKPLKWVLITMGKSDVVDTINQ